MTERQSKPPSGVETKPESAWRSAQPLIVAGLSADATVVVLAKVASAGPLLTALLATLAFASARVVCTFWQRDVATRYARRVVVQLQSAAFALLAIGIGAWLIDRLLGSGPSFYCEPFVPRRIEIALFGSFAVGYLTFMAHVRRRAWLAYPLIMVAMLWIAPFYGFFSAPLFLGISLNNMCANQPLIMVLLTAFGMIAGEQAGLSVAEWISGGGSAGRQ